METLESHMTERLRLSSSLVNDVCLNSGDLSAQSIRASAASSNSMAFGLAELSTKAITAREDVDRFKEDFDWVRNVKFCVWISSPLAIGLRCAQEVWFQGHLKRATFRVLTFMQKVIRGSPH